MTPERRAALRKMLKAATPRPWTTVRPARSDDGWPRGVIVAATAPRQGIYADPPGGTFPAADQELIAAARNDLPDLLDALDVADRIERLEAALRSADAVLSGCECAKPWSSAEAAVIRHAREKISAALGTEGKRT